jgi:[acyl-carrier-protein] S-malonyltransferase
MVKKDNVVYLFPGQGAQYEGMALDFLAGSTAVQKLFDIASAIIGKDAQALLKSDSDALKQTDVSQPAITLANLAAAAFLAEQGWEPAACAGFSLGEYAAMVCAGVISTEDCFRLVMARGEAMQRCADRLLEAAGGDASAVPGMAAVMGLSPRQAEELIARWGLKDLYAANINSPKQLVISGSAAALAEAEIRFKEAGARRVVRLQVAGPFHSPLMAGAAETFRPVLAGITFNDPAIPLYSNVTGKRISSGAEAQQLAIAHITSAVRWVEVTESLIADAKQAGGSFSACLEVGPGKVLQGLWKDTASGSNIPCYAAGTVEHIIRIEN